MSGRSGALASLSVLAVLALGGCGAGGADPAAAAADPRRPATSAYAPDRVAACRALPAARQRPCRDTITQALLAAIDRRHAAFAAALLDGAGEGGSAGRVTPVGFAGTPGDDTLLAALAAGGAAPADAAGEPEDARLAVALAAAMRTERARLALRIAAGLQAGAAAYPLGAALADLQAYDRAGTLSGALAALARGTGAEGPAPATPPAPAGHPAPPRAGTVAPAGGAAPPAGAGAPPIPLPDPSPAERAARQCLLRVARDPAMAPALTAALQARGLATPTQRAGFLTRPESAAQRVEVAARFCDPGAVEPRPPAPAGQAPSPGPAAAPAPRPAELRLLPRPDPSPAEAAATQCLLRAFRDPAAGPVLLGILRGRALTTQTQQARFLTHPDAAAGRVELAARFCAPGQAEPRPPAAGSL